jgi:two-component system, OmpR family, response regulator
MTDERTAASVSDRPRRVLLVEDNFDTADSILRAMHMRGIEAVHARTVAEALAAYEPNLFDVMVVDYELPDGNGLDFLAKIRGSDKAVTVLHSGLDRSKELAASGLEVTHQISKADPFRLFDVIEADRV